MSGKAVADDSETILIGTSLLASHHLAIDFPAQSVRLERASQNR
jgi:hypothetical protein